MIRKASSGGRRERAGWWLIAAVLFVSPGCIKQPDWIESTLVTVDVSGVWEGAVSISPGAFGPGVEQRAQLELEQESPKVTGMLVFPIPYSGPLEGRVGGDLFHFRAIASQGVNFTGEVTVSGDEMDGLM